MASSGERRMLFDIRGKRKHVVRVVYAILALLMGTSLFLVVGPVNIGELFGNSGSSNASEVFDEQVERVEGRLAKSPQDEQLLLSLTRAQISAGNAKIEPTSETEVPTVTSEVRNDFDAAWESWNRYLKQAGDEPNPTAAQLVAGSFFRLAESSTSLREAEENVAKATKTQRIAAEERPSIGSLSTLGIYEYFDGDFAGGDKATKQAAAKAPSKPEAKNIEKQLAFYRKRAKAFEKQKKQFAKAQSEASKEQLQNPLGTGLGGGSGATLGE